MFRNRLNATIIFIFAFCFCAAAQTNYSVEFLKYPGAAATRAFAINNQQQIAGGFKMPGLPARPLEYSKKSFTATTLPSAYNGYAQIYGINNPGDRVGEFIDEDGYLMGFLLDRHGKFQTIQYPGAFSTEVFGINDVGDMAGFYQLEEGGPYHGFLIVQKRYVPVDVPGAYETLCYDINNSGLVSGNWDGDGVSLGHGFLYNAMNQKFTTIDYPGAPENSSTLEGLNSRGDAVGVYLDDLGGQHSFLYSASGEFLPIHFDNDELSVPHQINDRGQIVGIVIVGTEHLGYIATPVPKHAK
jgi:hypothetical protein